MVAAIVGVPLQTLAVVTATIPPARRRWDGLPRRRRGRLAQVFVPRSEWSPPSSPAMTERPLCVNVLPVRITLGGGRVLVAPRDHARDHDLRHSASHRRVYQMYSHRDRAYAWALPGGALPALGSEWGEMAVDELPPEVVMFAVREAATARLVETFNFEALSGRLDAPCRLYRRHRNLAAFPGLEPDPRAAIFPLLLVQGIVLAEDTPAPVPALIFDVRTIQRISATLADLETAGIHLDGLSVRWVHGDGCTCAEPPRGYAGTLRGGDVHGDVVVDRRGQFQAPARCLRVSATATLVARYLGRLRGQPPGLVERRLAAATQEEMSGRRLWELLTAMQRNLSPLPVLGGATAELRPPAEAGDAAAWPRLLEPAPEPELNFRYGTPLTAGGAGAGLRKFGPYDQAARGRTGRVGAVVLTGPSSAAAAQKLARVLDHGLGKFAGMAKQFKLESFTVEVQTVVGDGADAYRAGAAAIVQRREKPDIVFPIVRWADRYLPVGQDPYRAAKAVLVGRDVASQAMTVETLGAADEVLQWTLSNVCVSAYAKIGNVPWVLHDPGAGREIILGIGRADTERLDGGGMEQLYGCTIVFRQDGDFLYAGSTNPVTAPAAYEESLTTQIREALETFEHEQGGDTLDHVIVHVFKKTGGREVRAARAALGNRRATLALVHVNRHAPLRLLTRDAKGNIRTPAAGTVVGLGPRDRLLVTGDPAADGDAHPLRLTLDAASTDTDLTRIVDQAYGLAAMSWRGLKRSRDPVTISYGHALAAKVGALRAYGLDPTGLGRRPWFL